ncbi:ABC transporter substrate-binding protein [Pusillimonas sp.]|uniref:ABC transporter substrate-binding protein n=1 Tax=Pusillimonas sp. TaxID=3040095 RepID=UPI0029BF98D6|nr:ABC transporter substrate-binding protein [Pusillimonas sp.]MDX3894016.1 ABC transporter substrate-binding protein [Pusillimonas sp.]
MQKHGFRLLSATAALAAFSFCSVPAAQAQEPFDLHVILPLTGGASFVGQATQRGMRVAEQVVNDQGGINGKPVRFVFHDDKTSPQVAVQLVNELKSQPVLLGSEIAGMCNAMAPLLAKGPFTYCMSPGIRPKAGSNMYTALVPLNKVAPTVLTYFRSKGWKRIALLVSTDASGQDALQGYEEAFSLPENAGLELVKTLHFNPTALNVSAQMTEIAQAKPDAMIGWATGAPAGIILKGFVQAGMDIPLVIGHGNVSPEFIKQYSSVVPEQLYFPAGVGAVKGDNVKFDERQAAARRTYLDALGKEGLAPENAFEVAWDPTMLTVDALRHVGPEPTAEAVRDYLSKVKGYAGISGIYDFVSEPNRGLSGKANVMAQWSAAENAFVAVSEPGGEPLAQ